MSLPNDTLHSLALTLFHTHEQPKPQTLNIVQTQFCTLKPLSSTHCSSAYCLDMCLQPSGVGTVQLSKSIFNFTDTQDVRVLVGCNAVINHRGHIAQASFLSTGLAYVYWHGLSTSMAVDKSHSCRVLTWLLSTNMAVVY